MSRIRTISLGGEFLDPRTPTLTAPSRGEPTDHDAILLVEDNDVDVELIEEFLLEAGLGLERLARAVRLSEAFARLQQAPVKVVLLDLDLPDSRGLDSLRSMVERFPEVPVVVLTGHEDSELALRALQYGAQDYLSKNKLDADSLSRSLRHAVERQRLLGTLREYSQQLAKRETALRRVFEDTTEGVVIVDEDGTRLFANAVALELLGQEFELGRGHEREQIAECTDGSIVQVATSETGDAPRSIEIRKRDTLWEGQPATLLSLRDVTQQRNDVERLRHVAQTDPLTGLANRALFISRLRRAIDRSWRAPHVLFGVIFLDLDRFKNVNDGLGHGTGDHLLIEVSNRLRRCVRDIDTVARLGGDEFTILLDSVRETADAVRVANRIQEELAKPMSVGGHELRTTLSAGIVIWDRRYTDPETMIRDADTALYRAKDEGKDCFRIFDRGMHKDVVHALSTESDLRRALEQQELFVVYQPIYDLDGARLDGFEALLRWNHPRRGLVSPGEFIPVAETTGLIGEMGAFVFEEACRQLARWRDSSPGLSARVAVNVSPGQLIDQSFVHLVANVLGETHLSPASLVVELTETVLIKNRQRAESALHALKDLGVRIALDDFGTGFSSLIHLRDFPIDLVKIDRRFVEEMEREAKTRQIVSSVIELAGSLQMKVVAEGVETSNQLEMLREMRCGFVQGYLLAAPMNVSDVTRRIVSSGLDGRVDSLLAVDPAER